jgi:hypothetical protein
MTAVGESTLDERERFARGLQQRHRAIAVLDRGSMGFEHEGAAIGVDQRMTLAPIHLLAGIVAARTACLVGLTFWLSNTAAEGLACRPARSRSRANRWWLIMSNTPSPRNRMNHR